MDKTRKTNRSTRTVVILFAVAAVLILTSVIGGARAMIKTQSKTYTLGAKLYSIGVSLMENNDADPVAYSNYHVKDDGTADGTWDTGSRKLFSKMLAEGENYNFGKYYTEELYAKNTGKIDEYVRIIFNRYWVKDGERDDSISPELIQLDLDDSAWILDQKESTDDTIILYYNKILPVGEKTSAPVLKGILVNGDILYMNASVTTDTWKDSDGLTHTRRTYSYDYDGVTFRLEVEVDAVQTHNAADAIDFVWGRAVNIDETTGALSLAEEKAEQTKAAKKDPDKVWTVTYTADSKMDDAKLSAEELYHEILGLEPGDDLSCRINLKNNNAKAVDWYMSTKILQYLEDQNVDADGNKVASGGKYVFQLTYTDGNGKQTVLFDSSDADQPAIKKAIDPLKDYFLMFTLQPGKEGHVDLYVKFDGPTLDNSYQSTLGKIQFQFLVQEPDDAPNTGDTMNALPYFIAIGIGGLAILGLAIALVVRRRRETGEVKSE